MRRVPTGWKAVPQRALTWSRIRSSLTTRFSPGRASAPGGRRGPRQHLAQPPQPRDEEVEAGGVAEQAEVDLDAVA